ncbi:hypothetical protein SCAR479_10457 [Seiridium cardinale]|uniref:Uncharacterized protein n=1 Tax=Seiridium cardinale TaxID=138064 RepID=A0ABR2XGP9_9PEZI
MAASICPAGADRSFGPRIVTGCRAFDFTLFFEDVFFSCMPAAVFLFLLPVNLKVLFRSEPVCSTRSKLCAGKLTTYVGIFVLQIAFLAVRAQDRAFETNASLAADALSLVATAGASVLSYLDHKRSLRPSTILSLYLSVLGLLDIARVRTFWLLSSGTRESAILTINIAFTLAALCLESVEKRKGLTPQKQIGSPDQYSSFWNRTTFAWLATTFRLGHSRVISLDDLPLLDTKLGGHVLWERLASAWAKYDPHAGHSLLRACFRAFVSSFLSPCIPRICLTGFTFIQPFLIDTTVTLAGLEEPEASYGKGLMGAWALTFVGMAVSTAVYQYQNFRFITRMRGALIGLIYQKTMELRSVDVGDVTAVALMGTDVERIGQSLLMAHEIWGSLLDIAVAIWLLERQLFIACVAPVLIVAVFIAWQYLLTESVKRSQRAWIEKVQARLLITSNVLNNMKAVKMLGLSQIMSLVLERARRVEIDTSRVFRKLLVWRLLLSNLPTNLAPVAAFAVYVIIAVFWKNESLLTSQAFTSVALISLLTTPVLVLIQTMPSLFQSIASFDRIQEYCNYTADLGNAKNMRAFHQPNESSISLQMLARQSSQRSQLPKYLIAFEGHSFGWDRQKLDLLKDLHVKIEQERITVIVGPIGSGKTTLLESILGETFASNHSVGKKLPSMAYCAQQPWLENGTVRDNIIGVDSYERSWYNRVVLACGLDPDIASLPKQDHTQVGSQGLNLSGGQKQRIALARAVYSKRSILLLDDVFSGMDAHTISHVAGQLFGRQGLLRTQPKTVVLATHNDILMALADTIITLDSGTIVETGTPDTLPKSNGHVSNLGLSLEPKEVTESQSDVTQIQVQQEQSRTTAEFVAQTDELLNDVQRKDGDLSVYSYYLASSGYLSVAIFTACVAAWVFCTEFPIIWLKWWSEANEEHPNQSVGLYMGIYAFLEIFGVVSVSVACWYAFVNMISASSDKLHSDLLESTLKAPFRFFFTTDVGTLTNRFSQDMELIDMNLPIVLVNYVTGEQADKPPQCLESTFRYGIFRAWALSNNTSSKRHCSEDDYHRHILTKYYLQTSRQVRLLEIEAKAPLYTHFLESVAGAATIRAFGWQTEYQKRNFSFIDSSQRPAYLQNCIQNALSFALGIIVAILTVILVAIVVTWPNKFSAGSVGISLVTIMTFGLTLARLIKMWTQMESSIGAVARVKRFITETESEGDEAYDEPPATWPQTGTIQLQSVVASYKYRRQHNLSRPRDTLRNDSSDAEAVLKGITMLVQPQQHVAICGRSGSGKSSLILCLLRMLEMQDGHIAIDGIDINTLSCSALRARINVVPQDPFLVPGTVRCNIDLFGAASDDEIMRSLQRVGLWAIVEDQGGLSREINIEAWSAGQKQLLCLARAMVKKGKLLVLDEVASSVDSETESIIQEIIDTEFKECTILSVMHRLKHIAKYDKVALLDNGLLVEYDDTNKLLATDSKFADLYRSNTK